MGATDELMAGAGKALGEVLDLQGRQRRDRMMLHHGHAAALDKGVAGPIDRDLDNGRVVEQRLQRLERPLQEIEGAGVNACGLVPFCAHAGSP